MQTGSNLRHFLEGEHAHLRQARDARSHDAAIARAAWLRSEAAVEHNNWQSVSLAEEAWEMADTTREAFRTSHREAITLRDMTAGLEVDLDMDEDDEDYDFI